jgi:excisionase family DNA binding protein
MISRVWLKTPAAAKALGLSERTLRRAAQSGSITGIDWCKVGRSYLWSEEDVAGLVAAKMQPTVRGK